MGTKIRIVVTEQQELLRKSLVYLLKEDNQLEIVDEALPGKDLIEKLKIKPADIVLLDLEEQSMQHNAMIDVIKNRFPQIKIIILGSSTNNFIIAELMSKGVSSYLSKNCCIETLFKSIHAVYKEGFYFEDNFSKMLLAGLVKDPLKNKVPEVTFKQREIEVLRGICDGLSNKEIAEILHVSASTVDFYRSSLYSKTKCKNIASIIKFALKKGIVSFA